MTDELIVIPLVWDESCLAITFSHKEGKQFNRIPTFVVEYDSEGRLHLHQRS